VVEDYEESYRATMSEKCDGKDDRVHCTCVPDLRRGLERLRGVVEAARHSLHFLRSPASGNHPARAIELDRLEKAFAALPSPAEAGEKNQERDTCQDPKCVFFGWHYMMHPGGKVCPPAAPSDAKAGERL
jgi:hypothetical protein